MTVCIKAKENILGVIKKGEKRNVANNFGLLMVKQGKAELIDFDGSEYALRNVQERERRKKILKKFGLPLKESYTQLQVINLIEKNFKINKEDENK